jgi:DNA (cytosine-5)-methyltransferase 1
MWKTLPIHLKISNFYSRGSTMRLDGDKPSPTLVPGHSNFSSTPRKKHRSITVREGCLYKLGFHWIINFFGSHSKKDVSM